MGYGYRTYSIEYVLSLIKLCVKDYGITHFHFEDDNLTLDMQRAKLLFKKLKVMIIKSTIKINPIIRIFIFLNSLGFLNLTFLILIYMNKPLKSVQNIGG